MEEITALAQIEAPYAKHISLHKVEYDNGFSLIRMRIKEGKRFTDMDLDMQTVTALHAVFSRWIEAESRLYVLPDSQDNST